MITTAIVLALAYAVTAALLLNLNLATRLARWIKFTAVVGVSTLYIVTWHGLSDLLGWATREPMPVDFRLHWVVIEEPDKAAGAEGKIYFWIRELDEAGLAEGAPRAYQVPWDEETAEAAEEALEELEGGQLLNGRMSRQIINPDLISPDPTAQYRQDESGSSGQQSRFEFIRLPPPTLPPKPI
ncbi:MAG: hypothetical protein CMQ50_05780 [Gammaproteobacteria bacterium]|nr:hypothetical protein [Gammaproteobacteria bacterium]